MAGQINRRGFLGTTAVWGAGLVMPGEAAEIPEKTKKKKSEDIQVGLIGVGRQGQRLLMALVQMGKEGGVRVRAVCDIWRDWHLKRAAKILEAYKHESRCYADYREMLAKEKYLDAVVIATPDFYHAEQAVACLEAGLHVYCETPMARTARGARRMVAAAKQAGKLLQIGQERRSDPKYMFYEGVLLREMDLLGRIMTVNGQGLRQKGPLGWPKRYTMEADWLKRFGYESMGQFMNWNNDRDMGGGPTVNPGLGQFDVFTWFLGARPQWVMGCGLTGSREGQVWPDNLHVHLGYETKEGQAIATYQILSHCGFGGDYESFIGEDGILIASDLSTYNFFCKADRANLDKCKTCVDKGYLISETEMSEINMRRKDVVIDVNSSVSTLPLERFIIPVEANTSARQAHLENFFKGIRGEAKLLCPGEVGYAALVTALKVNEAVKAEKKLYFEAGEFEV